MMVRSGIWFLLAVLLLSALSCARLPEKPAESGAALSYEQLPAPDSIPAAWGKLVSVTSNPSFPSWLQLWFEDETGTVRMAAFDFRTKKLDPNAVVIPRI
jgi:hypothetical protein